MSREKALGPSWQPAYIEAKLAVQAQRHGYFGTEPELSPEDQDKVMELVTMMTEEHLQKTYTNDAQRGKALALAPVRVKTLKATKLYKDTLIQMLQVGSLERVAASIPTMQARAQNPDDRQGVAAFDRMMRISGLGQTEKTTFTKTVNNNTINLTVDQQLQKFVAGRRGQVIEEASPALPEGLDEPCT